jgi:hypothetical protein
MLEAKSWCWRARWTSTSASKSLPQAATASRVTHRAKRGHRFNLPGGVPRRWSIARLSVLLVRPQRGLRVLRGLFLTYIRELSN